MAPTQINYVWNSSTDSGTRKVGLIYISDYLFASKNCYSSYIGSNYQYSECTSSNWLFNASYLWTISPSNNQSGTTADIINTGYVYHNPYGTRMGVRPVVYLKSNVVVKLDGSDGSEDHPYNITLDS